MFHYAGKVRFRYEIQVLRPEKESANLSRRGPMLRALLEL